MTLPAFPGAYGWGARATGGRGGTVIQVTNLNESGAGSFREACETPGPRIIVFTVGGTIDLGVDRLSILGDCTIAGQTAPGGGICIKSSAHVIEIENQSNIIMRYLRMRSTGQLVKSDTLEIYGINTFDLMIDHCSFSWGTDGVLDAGTNGCHHITIQNCMIYENSRPAHNTASLHGNGGHQISLYRNIYAHCDFRNPKLDEDQGSGKPDTNDPFFDMTNCVIYNWDATSTNVEGRSFINIVNNYWKKGPNTSKRPWEIVSLLGQQSGKLYSTGNVGPTSSIPTSGWGTGMIRTWQPTEILDIDDSSYSATKFINSEGSAYPPEIITADQSFVDVVANAGASRLLNSDGTFRNARDAADFRIVADIQAGTGGYIEDPSEVGGFPALVPGTAYIDTDADGMSDEWEIAHGLDPNNPTDGSIIRPDGHTNLESFLNGTEEVPIMSVVTDLQAVETALRQEILNLTAQADAIAQSLLDLQAVDDALDVAADVIIVD